MGDRVSVTSAEFIRNIGFWQTEALRRPVSITHHGRERLVLTAPDHFRSLADSEKDSAAKVEHADLLAEHAMLLDSMEEGYIAFDPGLRMITMNGAAEVFVGRPREAFPSGFIFPALPDVFASVLSDRLLRAFRTRKREQFEMAVGDGRFIAARIFPLQDKVILLFDNTTEEQRLKHEQEDCAAAEAALAVLDLVALLKLDANGRIGGVDKTFSGWTGFSSSEVEGHRLLELIAPASRRDVTALLEQVLRTGAAAQASITVVHKKGDEVRGCLSLAPVVSDFVVRGARGLWILENSPASSVAAA